MRLNFRAERITANLSGRDAAQLAATVPLALDGRAHLVFEDDYVPMNQGVSAFATMVALPTSVSFVSDSQWPEWCREYGELLNLSDRWPEERISDFLAWLVGTGDRMRPGAMVGYWPSDREHSPRARAEADTVDITVRLPDVEYVALQRWLEAALLHELPLPHISLIGMYFGRDGGTMPTWAEFTAGDVRVASSYATIDLTPAPGDARR